LRCEAESQNSDEDACASKKKAKVVTVKLMIRSQKRFAKWDGFIFANRNQIAQCRQVHWAVVKTRRKHVTD
jgi:hypothetical protein